MADSPKLASSLESARPNDLVHVDGKGRVRSPARFKAILGTYWGILALLIVAEGWLGYTAFGPLGVSIAVALGALAGWVGSRAVMLWQGVRAMNASRLDEAERIFRRIAEGRFVRRQLRAIARANLARCASLRGDAAAALQHARDAVRLHGRSRSLYATMARYSEVHALIATGELAEARAKLAAVGPAPEGDYLRMSHWTSELYLAFREGRHDLSEDELHARAHVALSITSAGTLLALLAWAFGRTGDHEMRELLLGEARDRHPGALLTACFPGLQTWMDQSEPPPSPEAGDEEEDELEAERPSSRRARAR